jgi:hypothetical protein
VDLNTELRKIFDGGTSSTPTYSLSIYEIEHYEGMP